MNDTIQVVRVDATVRRISQTRVLVRMSDGGHRVVPVDDVIELTEERVTLCHVCDMEGPFPSHDEQPYEERQWVSEWEAIND